MLSHSTHFLYSSYCSGVLWCVRGGEGSNRTLVFSDSVDPSKQIDWLLATDWSGVDEWMDVHLKAAIRIISRLGICSVRSNGTNACCPRQRSPCVFLEPMKRSWAGNTTHSIFESSYVETFRSQPLIWEAIVYCRIWGTCRGWDNLLVCL